jgi:arylsulfatase A-like enzyme
LQAVRKGNWKLRLPNLKELRTWTENDHGTNKTELYNLARDLSETTNVAAEHPDIVKRLMALAEEAKVVRVD